MFPTPNVIFQLNWEHESDAISQNCTDLSF